jgi:ankyrin repeat protein
MNRGDIIDRISRGRTDLVFDLLRAPDWRTALNEGEVKPLSWFVYYGDVTAMKAIEAAGGDLASIDLDTELGHACFFGHWKMADFLLSRGADPRAAIASTGETPLHSALSKAGRPAYFYIVRLLIERGADPNAKTWPGVETGAFMRDVRTRGETPLHRAAAFADAETIAYLLDHGADKSLCDAQGDTPLSWASWHLRPGAILRLLAHGPHQVSEKSASVIVSDHGAGWGNGMERKILGDYLPESAAPGAP